jgi:ankyrin repeat protein
MNQTTNMSFLNEVSASLMASKCPQIVRTFLAHKLQDACADGHLQKAKWLKEAFGPTADDARADNYGNDALWGACENGHLEVAKWLKEAFSLDAQ